MVKTIALCGLLLDVASTLASVLGNCGQFGIVAWIVLNVLLFGLPMAYHVVQPLVVAMHDAPAVLRVLENE